MVMASSASFLLSNLSIGKSRASSPPLHSPLCSSFLRSLPHFSSSSSSSSFSFHCYPQPFNLTSQSCFSLPLLPLLHLQPLQTAGNNNNNNSNNNNNNNNNGGNGWDSYGFGESWNSNSPVIIIFFFCRFLTLPNSDNSSNSIPSSDVFLFLLSLSCFVLSQFHSASSALARTHDASNDSGDEEKQEEVWEVRGGKWSKLLPDPSKDAFVLSGTSLLFSWKNSLISSDDHVDDNVLKSLGLKLLSRCNHLFLQLMLPNGYPHSVTSDYMEYSLWRGVQGVASQISAVLATQALLYAVGLGKGAIPTAAAINWVLKDGIGYLSKIMLSKYGRHFDVNPKGWRLFADLLENAAFGMEILTPAFPHLFVFIGAAAGAGRSAAALIQAATRSCFYAGFAAQRNFAEVIAKGEAQGMVSKSIGIMLGIALANCVGSSTPFSLASFAVITALHMFCNLKSYQAVLLRTLNPYRASLVFSEYLLSGQIPDVKEVNDEEPIFPCFPRISANLMRKIESQVLSSEAKAAACEIEQRLQLGSKLSELVFNKEDAIALFDLYGSEGYMLTEHRGRFCIVLKEGSSPQDMLKSLFQVNYLYWLEKNMGIESRSISDDCKPGGKLQISLDYARREFIHVKYDGELAGWTVDGLIARPLPNRIRLDYAGSSPTTQ